MATEACSGTPGGLGTAFAAGRLHLGLGTDVDRLAGGEATERDGVELLNDRRLEC